MARSVAFGRLQQFHHHHARVRVSALKRENVGMKRLLVAAILAMTVSPAMAADDWVMLHCAGENAPIGEPFRGSTQNIYMRLDGTEMSLNKGGSIFKRTVALGHLWRFDEEDNNSDIKQYYEFFPGSMGLTGVFEINGNYASGGRYSCFPITNPFTQGTE